MIRAHDRLNALAGGDGGYVEYADIADALIHFFMDAYHLKDWIKNDKTLTATGQNAGVEDLFGKKGTDVMKICADLANGIKHNGLGGGKFPPKTGDPTTAILRQHATVRPATVAARADIAGPVIRPATSKPATGASGRPPVYNWSVKSNRREYDVLTELAGPAVVQWQAWQSDPVRRLLP